MILVKWQWLSLRFFYLLRDSGASYSTIVTQCASRLTKGLTFHCFSYSLVSGVTFAVVSPCITIFRNWVCRFAKKRSTFLLCWVLYFWVCLFCFIYFCFSVVTVEVVEEEEDDDEEVDDDEDDENDKEEKDQDNSKSDSSEREELWHSTL